MELTAAVELIASGVSSTWHPSARDMTGRGGEVTTEKLGVVLLVSSIMCSCAPVVCLDSGLLGDKKIYVS